jgi:PBP1b-binding outer membrane lipoprotein LpoB
MKKLITALLLALLLSGCESSTDLGACIGINDSENPKLVYKYSVQNIVVGALLVETIFVPIIVVLNEIKCPVDKKP